MDKSKPENNAAAVQKATPFDYRLAALDRAIAHRHGSYGEKAPAAQVVRDAKVFQHYLRTGNLLILVVDDGSGSEDSTD